MASEKQPCPYPGCKGLPPGRSITGYCGVHSMRLRQHGDLETNLMRPWTATEKRRLTDILDDTPGGIGRAPLHSVGELAVKLERTTPACYRMLSLLRKERERGFGLDLIC